MYIKVYRWTNHRHVYGAIDKILVDVMTKYADMEIHERRPFRYGFDIERQSENIWALVFEGEVFMVFRFTPEEMMRIYGE